MQQHEITEELQRQISLREQNIRLPSDDDINRLIEEGYIHEKPYYYHADIGDFFQAWSNYLKDHPSLSITERIKRWLQAKIKRMM